MRMKKVIFFVVIVLLLVAIPVTVYFLGKQQDIRSKAAPATTIQFNPQTVTKQVDDSFPLDIKIDTGTNMLASVKIQLVFDATVLEAESITNGPLAPNITASGTVGPGSASITVAAASTTSPITGSGTIAVVRFKAKAATTVPATVRFDSTTYASGFEETQNAIISSIPVSITITRPAVTAITANTTGQTTPTGTPSITPTLTPSLTPLPTSATGAAETATQSAEPTGAPVTAVTITLPENGQVDVPTYTPTIQGTAPAGATVTLIFDSPSVTTTVIADPDGHWMYISPILTGAHHTVTATAVTASGQTSVASTEFSIVPIAGFGYGGGEAMPQTGNFTTTLFLIASAVLFIGFGISLPH